jgi:hypothetical protein
MKALLLPSKIDVERDAVAIAWQDAGGSIFRVDRFWEKPALPEGVAIAIYGNDTFALVLAQNWTLKPK